MPQKNYTAEYHLAGGPPETSSSFTTDVSGSGSFTIGPLQAADIGRTLRINSFNVASGCTWNANANNETVLSESGICAVLPVQLSFFRVHQKNNGIQLEWETASEENSSHFEIEHRTSNRDWASLGSVKATGRGSTRRQYRYFHKDPLVGNNWYRLKMVDKDGRSQYSAVERLDITRLQQLILSPNPVSSELSITESPIGIRSVSTLSLDGKMVQRPEPFISGRPIDVSRLPKGIYTVQIVYNNGQTENRRIMKQ